MNKTVKLNRDQLLKIRRESACVCVSVWITHTHTQSCTTVENKMVSAARRRKLEVIKPRSEWIFVLNKMFRPSPELQQLMNIFLHFFLLYSAFFKLKLNFLWAAASALTSIFFQSELWFFQNFSACKHQPLPASFRWRLLLFAFFYLHSLFRNSPDCRS